MFKVKHIKDTLILQKTSYSELINKSGGNKTNLADFRSNSDDKGLVDYTWQNASKNESVLTFDLKGKNIELEDLPYEGDINAIPNLNSKFVAEHNIIYGEINTAIENSEITVDTNNMYKITFNGKLKLPQYSAGLFAYYNPNPSQMPYCKEIDLTNVDMNNIVNGSYMFYYCQNLASLDLSKFTGGNVTNTYRMFHSCQNLTSIDISKFTGENLENASEMFNWCQNLTSLDLSEFTGESLEDASEMFNWCESLTSLDLSKFTGESLENASWMFRCCKSLTSLDLSKFTGESLENASNMFNALENLNTLIMKGSAINRIVNLDGSCLSLDTGITVENNKTYSCTCTYDYSSGVKITEVQEYVA